MRSSTQFLQETHQNDRFSSGKGGFLDFEDQPRNLSKDLELESAIVSLFRAQLELEKRLERMKVDLALRTDFNLIDTFRIFD